MVDVPQVQAFVEVATRGSFSRAATALFLTQPSVSARVATLERALGQRLFDRHGRGVRLTPAGTSFLPFAERMLKTISDGYQALETAQSAEGGIVSVAAALSVSTYLLPAIVKSFRDEHPRARVSIRSGHSRDGLRMVLDEEAEIGLARGLAHPSVQTIRLGRDEILLVGPPVHRFAPRKQVRLKEVAGEPLILFDKGSSDWVLITGFFRRGGLVPHVILELEGIEAAKKMVEQGIGIAMLPHLAVRQELRRGSLVSVTVGDARLLARHVDLVYRRKGILTKIAQAFRQHVQSVYPRLSSEEAS